MMKSQEILLLMLWSACLVCSDDLGAHINITVEDRMMFLSLTELDTDLIYRCLCLQSELRCSGTYKDSTKLGPSGFDKRSEISKTLCKARSYNPEITFKRIDKYVLYFQANGLDYPYTHEAACEVLGLIKMKDGCHFLTNIYWLHGETDVSYILHCECSDTFTQLSKETIAAAFSEKVDGFWRTMCIVLYAFNAAALVVLACYICKRSYSCYKKILSSTDAKCPYGYVSHGNKEQQQEPPESAPLLQESHANTNVQITVKSAREPRTEKLKDLSSTSLVTSESKHCKSGSKSNREE